MVTMTARIDEKLQAGVAAGAVPGVVAMAAGPDGVLYEGAAGRRSAAADDPITPDTMMRIASMTKMVTTTAALQLIERGSLSLDAPVSEYRPGWMIPRMWGFVRAWLRSMSACSAWSSAAVSRTAAL